MKHKIAVVDDNASYNKLISRSLEHEGFDVSSYTDADQAYEDIVKGEFHLVLCDWMMPKVDGIALMNRVRDKNTLTPFWFISAAKDNTFIQKAYDSGAHKVSFKDDNKNELVVDITNFFLEKTHDKHEGYITTYLPSHTFKDFEVVTTNQHTEIICHEEIALGTILTVNSADKMTVLKVENLERLENGSNSHICIKL